MTELTQGEVNMRLRGRYYVDFKADIETYQRVNDRLCE